MQLLDQYHVSVAGDAGHPHGTGRNLTGTTEHVGTGGRVCGVPDSQAIIQPLRAQIAGFDLHQTVLQICHETTHATACACGLCLVYRHGRAVRSSAFHTGLFLSCTMRLNAMWPSTSIRVMCKAVTSAFMKSRPCTCTAHTTLSRPCCDKSCHFWYVFGITIVC